MSEPAPTPTPTDPLGSKLDLHVTGLSGLLTLGVLWLLQSTVWRSIVPPTDLGYIVSSVVSYGVSQVSGRLVRTKLSRTATAAPTPPADPPEPPASAMA